MALTPACAAPSCDFAFFVIPAIESMLTIEDGTIVEGADAYIDVAFVDAHALRYAVTTWSGTTLVKEQAILIGMRLIEDFERQFCGCRVSAAQELAWPREKVPDPTGAAYLDNDVIPRRLKEAVAEAAIIVNQSGTINAGLLLSQVETSLGQVSRQRRRVGPLETETEYVGGVDQNSKRRFETIMAALKPYICRGEFGWSEVHRA